MFYFVTAVGCFWCPRSRRLDYNITNGTGCQHYFSSFLVFFWKFLPCHQESQCLCGFAAFYIYNKISHFAEFYCIFCIFSLFLSTLFRCYCIYGSIFFITVLPAKHYLLPRAIFCFYKKQKNCRSSPGSFFFYSFYLLFIRSLYSSKSAWCTKASLSSGGFLQSP